MNCPRLLFFLLLSLACPVAVLAQDTAQSDDNFKAFLLLFGCFILAVTALALVLGALLILLVMLLFGALAAAGVVSAATVYAIYRRSVTAGFRAMVILIAIGGGALIGAVVAFIGPTLLGLQLNIPFIMVWGAAGGALGGWLLGRAINAFGKILWKRLARKIA